MPHVDVARPFRLVRDRNPADRNTWHSQHPESTATRKTPLDKGAFEYPEDQVARIALAT